VIASREPAADALAARHDRAWRYLTAALAAHVADEALTGFLDFYNPLVLSIRARLWWFPMPTFTFGMWLGGLALLVVVLALLGPWVRRGGAGSAAASWLLSVIMVSNGAAHLAGSLFFARWLPGATSSPLLLIAGVMLARRTHARRAAERALARRD
jgi:hypothetical protein